MKKRGKSRPKTQKATRQRQAGPPVAAAHARGLAVQRPQDTQRQTLQSTARLVNGKNRHVPATVAVPAYAADERHALALLLLPVLFVAASLGLSQTLKPVGRLIEAARQPAPPVQTVTIPGRIALNPIGLPTTVPSALRAPVVDLPGSRADISVPTPVLSLPMAAPAVAALEPPAVVASLIVPPPPVTLPLAPPAFPAVVAPLASLACHPTPKRPALSTPPAAADFGQKLAEAAKAQTNDFVIYSATYKRIAYPMGDVPSLYGACSDLVIRAYRALGIDLQDLVQRARVGRGDPNIDHRRTDTLRAFFAKHGEVISASGFAEDYKPGDVVTYYRPFSRVSRAHIAIVSDMIGPSGQPMIVHNRGWGPQVEDALFVDRITGHYRFTGAQQLLAPAGRLALPSPRDVITKPNLPVTKAPTSTRAVRTAEQRGMQRQPQ